MAGIALALLCVGCEREEKSRATSTPPVGGPSWLTDFSAAQARAGAEDKLLLINFTGSDWCPPCLMLHRQILSRPEFADYAAKHLVLLEVDFPHRKPQSEAQKAANEKLADRFGIYGFPTIIILDSDGKKLGEFGYTQAARSLSSLRSRNCAEQAQEQSRRDERYD